MYDALTARRAAQSFGLTPKFYGKGDAARMPVVRDFKIGKVAATQSSSGFLHGFSICAPSGAPLISIHYGTEAEAEAARQAVKDALGNAVEVVTPN